MAAPYLGDYFFSQTLARIVKAADVAVRLRMRLRSLLRHQPHPPPTARKVKPQESSGRAGGFPILISKAKVDEQDEDNEQHSTGIVL